MPASTPAWPYQLSRRAITARRSMMRELMPLTTRSDIISFAGGLPAPDLFPVEDYQVCLDHVLTTEGRRALQYGPIYPPLKEALAHLMKLRGVDANPADIFITNGAQQGLSLVGQLLLNPNSPIIVEQIAFTGIGQMIAERGAMPFTVATDLEHGIDVDNVEYLLKLTGQVRAIIEVPDFHNPLGVSIAAERRPRLVELSQRFRTPIIEDDPYGLLRYEGENTPPLKARDEKDGIIYLGSFSKILAPGLRLGWVVAPQAALSKLTVLKESQDLETSQLTQRAVAEFIQRGLLNTHLEKLKVAYTVRRKAMLDALEREFPREVQWSKPKGGIFIWATLPDQVNTWNLLPQAVEQEKIAFVPGFAFGIQGGGQSSMRLNFSNATPESIEEGIRRLGRIVQQAVR
ncbi:MAG TPA: PLP-dependent aminotransferase family protein [Anaerolineae bacterium]|nr:PLP-dependent aminotransferase family protein [Anaerolineae bacterium]